MFSFGLQHILLHVDVLLVQLNTIRRVAIENSACSGPANAEVTVPRLLLCH
jgi:hypothetical protein